MNKTSFGFSLCLLGVILGSCEEPPSDDCNIGELNCACNAGQCLAGLTCEDNVCVQQSADEVDDESTSSETGTSSDTETTSDTETATTSEESTSDTDSDTTSSTDESETGPMCDPPQMSCNGECVDVMTDDLNCGACGNECTIALGEGGCVDGACTPTWSSCVESNPLTQCSAVCQAQGFQSCAICDLNNTVLWFSIPADCDIGESTDEEGRACNVEPDFALSNFYRCCCAQQ